MENETDRKKKTGHWIWYIYPNILGKSTPINGKYEITSEDYDKLLQIPEYRRAKELVDNKIINFFKEEDFKRVFNFRKIKFPNMNSPIFIDDDDDEDPFMDFLKGNQEENEDEESDEEEESEESEEENSDDDI